MASDPPRLSVPRISLPDLFARAVKALEPGALVREYLRRDEVPGQAITVLALGKAAVAMSLGAREALGDRIACEVVVAPVIPPGSPPGWMESDHPVPTARSCAAARALLAAAAQAPGPILALVSGGGSALATLPAGDLSLAELNALVQEVYAAGANIEELNVVRKHLSAFKGGWLSAAAATSLTTLVVSDVVGDSLSAIASGPTCADASTYQQAIDIALRYCGPNVAGPAFAHLRAGALGHWPETPKDPRPGDRHVLLAGMASAVAATIDEARAQGAAAHALPRAIVGDVEAAADYVFESAVAGASGPGLWVGGGETTIAVSESPGIGGRAQHLALLLARAIAGRPRVEILVAGTDGIDGNSRAAGALVDGNTWAALLGAGLDPQRALKHCDSGRALAAVGAQLTTGPTGINHADLVMVQIW